MGYDEFFRVQKAYIKELNRVENQYYCVGEASEDYLTFEIFEGLEILTGKVVKGIRF